MRLLPLLPLLLGGCPGAPAAVDCPNESPSCPNPAPGYASDVGPLVATYCTRCHSPGGVEPSPLLRSYEEVTTNKVLSQISSCKMPPDGEPQPTAAERTLILSWFACCAVSDAGVVCPP